MQKPASLHIPKPCHENWNAMTTTQQGKFCAACSKEVIDFSLMSDGQILNVLAQQNGTLCGRFHHDQLERNIVETKVKKSKSLWLAFTLPFMILFQKSFGQKNDTTNVKATQTVTENRILMGKPLMINRNEQALQQNITISGNILDDRNLPLWGASVIVKGTHHGVITDSLGRFHLTLPRRNERVVIELSYVGYSTTEKIIDITEDTSNISITLAMTEQITMGMVVTTHVSRRNKKECKKITITEKIDSTIKKLTGISPVSIYPNPASKGNFISINFKQEGTYDLQLLNNESQLIRVEKYSASQKNASVSFSISGNLSSGIYYLRIINTKTRKSYTEKLLVQ